MQKKIITLCKICEGPASHSNYGVLTCDSCKIFFRRNAKREQNDVPCRFGGNCQINILHRNICTSCRLAKCFAYGMQLDLIRGPRSGKGPNRPRQISIVQSDTSTILNSNEWELLSNLTDNYDEQKLLLIAQQFINQSDDITLPIEFFRNIYETSGAYIRSNDDLCTLTSDDRSIFLRNLADNITCLSTAFTLIWTHLYQYQPFINIFIDVYGENSMLMIQRILKFIDPDTIVAKLTVSLFGFSINMSIFSSSMNIKPFDTLAIFRIQNIYVELTWKYLVYKYGYDQSIQRFNNLTQCLLAATTTVSDAQTIDKHTNDIQSLTEQIELELLLDDMEGVAKKFQ